MMGATEAADGEGQELISALHFVGPHLGARGGGEDFPVPGWEEDDGGGGTGGTGTEEARAW